MRSDSKPATIARQLDYATQALTKICEAPRLEAELLLGHALQKPRTHLIAWPEKALSKPQLEQFTQLLERRLAGEPAAYITGHREFWSLELETTPDTLIPRPDTELLVERALELLPADRPFRAADLGTGSGAIAIAIASERPLGSIIASDLSDAALQVARRNIKRHRCLNIRTVQGSWFEALDGFDKLDLIISNPPYVESGDPHLEQNGLPWEPRSALVAGIDGLDDIRILTAQAGSHLNPGGWLVVEHGYNQGRQARQLFEKAGFQQISTQQDLAGQDRLTEGQIPRPT